MGESGKPAEPGGIPPAPVESIPAIPGTGPVNQSVNPLSNLEKAVNDAAAQAQNVIPVAEPTTTTPQEKFKEFNDKFGDKPVVNVPEDTVPLDPNIVGAKILSEAPAGDSAFVAEVPPSEQVEKTPEELLQEEVKTAIKFGAEEQEKKIGEAVDKFLEKISANRAKTALS